MSTAQASLVTLYEESANSAVSSLDFQAAKTSLKILFGNMQETGYNKSLSTLVANRQSEIVNIDVQQAVASVKARLKSIGITPTDAQMQKVFASSAAQRAALVRQVGASGLQSLEQRLISDMIVNGPPHPVNAIYRTSGSGAKLKRVDCAGSGAFAGFLGLISPPPVDGIMAGLAVCLDIMGLLGMC